MSEARHTPLLGLVGISKSYGGVHALSDVSFAIQAASVHALVGENGAGKSTLVKILTGSSIPIPASCSWTANRNEQATRRLHDAWGSSRCIRNRRSSRT